MTLYLTRCYKAYIWKSIKGSYSPYNTTDVVTDFKVFRIILWIPENASVHVLRIT